ncbi:MAG: VOC family protein [Pseudonocardia sp.]
MTVEPYFHIGVVVPDLTKAMTEFSRVLGMTFAEPGRNTVPWLSDPDPHPQDVHVTYSMDGPPYYELIEANGDGIFSARAERSHLHLGFWEADMEGRMRTLAAQGIGLDAVARAQPGAVPDWIITRPDVLGIRLEYVSTLDRPGIERWVQTGIFGGLQG